MMPHPKSLACATALALLLCAAARPARADGDTTPTLTQDQAYQAVAQSMIAALATSDTASIQTQLPAFDKADSDLALALTVARLRFEASQQGPTPPAVAGIGLLATENVLSAANVDRGNARQYIDLYLAGGDQRTLAIDGLTSAIQSNNQASRLIGPIQQQLASTILPPQLLVDVQTTDSVAVGQPISLLVTLGNVGDTTATNVQMELRRDALGKDSFKVNLGAIGPMGIVVHQMSIVAPATPQALPLMLNVRSDHSSDTSQYVEIDITTGGP